VLAAFVRAGLVSSTSEARRQIKGGGLKVNDRPVADERAAIGLEDVSKGMVKLSLGKKRHVVLRVT
jgi:tyrosyl-tRNA synthetase